MVGCVPSRVRAAAATTQDGAKMTPTVADDDDVGAGRLEAAVLDVLVSRSLSSSRFFHRVFVDPALLLTLMLKRFCSDTHTHEGNAGSAKCNDAHDVSD